ncbi:MAG TPA: LysR substrate-binding domain-containing protein [Candidatus Dormibacteraeota bacterium]
MELRQLRAFLQVASAKHFGKAAAALRITQPALTQRIQALERELRVQLMTRSAREVRLTAAGEVLLPYATRLIHIEDQALRELEDNAAGRAGTLRIGYLLHGDVAMQGRIVAEFRRRFPTVCVETTVADSIANLELLQAGDADAAFIGPLRVPPDIRVQSAGPSALVVALPQDHPLAQLPIVPVASLRGVPVIMWPESWNPELQASFKLWLARHTGEEPNIVGEEPADQAVEAVAASGSAVTFVSGWRMASALAGVAFRSLVPEPLIEHQVAYVGDNPSPLLPNLLRITQAVAAANGTSVSKDAELL